MASVEGTTTARPNMMALLSTPSIIQLFWSGGWPLTEIDAPPCRVETVASRPLLVPGTSRPSCMKWRPLSGSCLTWVSSINWLTEEVSELTTGVLEVTVMVSVTCPG